MRHHYVWLVWSGAFLLPWIALYLAYPGHRKAMWRTSLVSALLGLTEPVFVPAYWNPPSLFELARRTGFDIESLIFMFAVGGIGAVLYNAVRRQHLVPVNLKERNQPLHRLHLAALFVPFVLFVPLSFLHWNPIYPSIVCLVIGAIASAMCRPEVGGKALVGGVFFFGLYAVFMLGLKWSAPGYIEEVWNLPALRGGLFYGIPLEELLLGFGVGLYWTGVYEHFTWQKGVGSRAGGTHERAFGPR
ncbi:MAG: lycopene cyclase domain-containing protein [Thermoanaerobaculia bacterium]